MSSADVSRLYNAFFGQFLLGQDKIVPDIPLIRSLGTDAPELYQKLLLYHREVIRTTLKKNSSTGGFRLIPDWCIEIRDFLEEYKPMFYPTLESIILDKIRMNEGDLTLIPFPEK